MRIVVALKLSIPSNIMLFNLHISFNLYLVNGHKYMLAIKRTTLLPINCCYGISVFAKSEAVLILIPLYTVILVYRPTPAQLLLRSYEPIFFFSALSLCDVPSLKLKCSVLLVIYIKKMQHYFGFICNPFCY